MIKKRPTAKIDTSAIEGILNLMADQLRHMHDRLNGIAAVHDTWIPPAKELEELHRIIITYQRMLDAPWFNDIVRNMKTLQHEVHLLGRREKKKPIGKRRR